MSDQIENRLARLERVQTVIMVAIGIGVVVVAAVVIRFGLASDDHARLAQQLGRLETKLQTAAKP